MMIRKPLNTSPAEWAAADRMIAVVLLHQAGVSFQQIGQAIGISRGRASSLYKKAISSRVARYCWFQRCLELNARMGERAQP